MRILNPFLFASDIDGTLVPIGKKSFFDMGRTRQLLLQLRKSACPICYVTGRNLAMTKHVLREHDLIFPDWWVCDLGSEIYDRQRQPVSDWNKRNDIGPIREHITQRLQDVQGLMLQEYTRQGPGKCCYYSTCGDTERVKQDVNKRLGGILPQLRTVTSIDKKTGTTLVDVISAEAGKSRAVSFIASLLGFESNHVHFSGDSGNDMDALLSGMCATLVGNAASFVRSILLSKIGSDTDANVYLAKACYGDGVIEGLHAHAFAYPENWRHSTCE